MSRVHLGWRFIYRWDDPIALNRFYLRSECIFLQRHRFNHLRPAYVKKESELHVEYSALMDRDISRASVSRREGMYVDIGYRM
jgi:hypothetical protein